MFDRIEFRGVGWKKEKFTPGSLGNKKAAFGNGMKYYPLQLRFLVPEKAKMVRKPKTAIHRSVILKRRKNSVAYLSSDNTTALILSSTKEYMNFNLDTA